MGKGQQEIRGFALLSRKILFSWATRMQRLGQRWNSLLRKEKWERNSISPALAKTTSGSPFGSGIPLWFPIAALNSGPKTYPQIAFERMIWVMFLTWKKLLFSTCDFEVLPTVSVILILILNGNTALETGHKWHFPGLDIEQGHMV